MKTKEKTADSKEKSIRIRFRDESQVKFIREAAKQQGLSFNLFVIHASETTAQVLLKKDLPSGLSVVADAAKQAHRER